MEYVQGIHCLAMIFPPTGSWDLRDEKVVIEFRT